MSGTLRNAAAVALTNLLVVMAPLNVVQPEPEGQVFERGLGNQDDGDQTVEIQAESGYLPAGSEGARGSSCTEQSSVDVQIADDFTTPVTAGFYLVDIADGQTLNTFTFNSGRGQAADTRLFSPTGRWFRYNCGDDFYLFPEGGPAVSIPGLLQNALDQLDPPDPTLAVTPDHGRHVVRMPSWLAVEPAYWNQPREATATAGRVEVTATLDPFETVWDLGNGETLTCDNPGTVWSAGMAETQSTCSHIYTEPSINPPNHTWDLTGTVRFDVGLVTNAPGTYGPFVPVERTTIDSIEVLEIQAVGR